MIEPRGAKQFPDGVWWVDLAAVTDPDRVPQALAAAAGLSGLTLQGQQAALTKELQRRRALVVIDNCEHLAAACEELCDGVLPACPGLVILATSRIGRRLGVPVVELTVDIGNQSAHTFEAWLRGELRYGAQRRPAVRYLTPPGPSDIGSVQLIAIGESSDPYRSVTCWPPTAEAMWCSSSASTPGLTIRRLLLGDCDAGRHQVLEPYANGTRRAVHAQRPASNLGR